MARNNMPALWAELVPDAPDPVSADELLRRYSDALGYEPVEGCGISAGPHTAFQTL